MDIKQDVLSTILFYDLLDYPLSVSEIFKYLSISQEKYQNLRLIDIFNNIENELIEKKNGLYYLAQNERKIKQRIKREKITAQKWKKIKKICKILTIIPFIRGIGVSGSLTLFNAKKESDFDLIIITETKKIWTTRFLLSIFLNFLNQKRTGAKTEDKICLNCFVTVKSLEIKEEIKPHNLYSAQEYARIIPIFENRKSLWQEFKTANFWIKNYVFNYPWPQPPKLSITNNKIINLIRIVGEKMLNNPIGNFMEILLKNQQIKRIKRNLTNKPDDQIFFSDEYLFFHPHSKSLKLLNRFYEAIYNIGLKQ